MIEHWFSTPVYIADNIETNNLKNYEKIIKNHNIEKNNRISLYQKKHGVYTSYCVDELTYDPLFQPLRNEILKHNRILLSSQGYDSDWIDKMKITNMWFSISKKGSALSRHLHPGTISSGVFYVKSSPKNKIIFWKKDSMILPPTNPNKESYEYVIYECLQSRLLIFKSDLEHSCPKQLEKEKIIISFNIA